MSNPATRAHPPLGLSRPVIILMDVVLPAPLGPRKGEKFALRHVEIEIVHGAQPPEILGEAVGLDHGESVSS